MRDGSEIDRFAEDPRLLVELCHAVVARFDARVPSTSSEIGSSSMELQLREIAKTIDRLEKMSVPIPDVLRAEKTRLAVVLGEYDAPILALEQLAESLGAVVRDIRTKLERRRPKALAIGDRVERGPSDRLLRSVLRTAIINALRQLGGRASTKKILSLMEIELQEKFLPGDLVWQASKKAYAWQRAVENERPNMIRDGVLQVGSMPGIWELGEEFK